MIRATTPTHTFNIHTNDVKELLITYKQGMDIVMEKTLKDVEVNNGIITYRLTQEETKRFRPGTVDIQVRVLTNDGVALASQIMTIRSKGVLNDEVLR